MSRTPRKLVDSEVYHIILRGNDRQDIFYDDSDRTFFIQRIKKYSRETNIELYAYCLMDNHVHLLIGNGNQNMPLFVKKLACSYVYRFNHKYERTGHLFQGRYKSEPVETAEYFMTVYRYILKNPEYAHISKFNNYKWNSFFHEENNEFIKKSFVLQVFESEDERINFLNKETKEICMEDTTDVSQRLHNDALKIEFIKELFGISNILSLLHAPENIKIDRLRVLKKMGIPINQIARITGINRYYIKRA